MIDSDYPVSPTDPPFCRPARNGYEAFRYSEGTLVVYDRNNPQAWIRSDGSVEPSELR